MNDEIKTQCCLSTWIKDYFPGIGQLLLGVAACFAVFKIPEYRVVVELREQLKSVRMKIFFLNKK